MRCLLALLLLGIAPLTRAETISVCYNYGCLAQAEVNYDDRQLAQVRAFLADARDAADERQRLSLVIGWLLGWAGEQTPIAADRGGNFADQGVDGRMDCIDHSTTGSRLLRLLASHGWLRFHRVLEPEYRVRYLVQVHYSAQIEEIVGAAPPSAVAGEPARYVVDSWFRANGEPAVVMALPSWLAGREDDAVDQEAVAPAVAAADNKQGAVASHGPNPDGDR